MSSILRFPTPHPLAAPGPTPDDLRALLETFMVARPGDLAPLATWLRVTVAPAQGKMESPEKNGAPASG